jgi:hypothetical protein
LPLLSLPQQLRLAPGIFPDVLGIASPRCVDVGLAVKTGKERAVGAPLIFGRLLFGAAAPYFVALPFLLLRRKRRRHFPAGNAAAVDLAHRLAGAFHDWTV